MSQELKEDSAKKLFPLQNHLDLLKQCEQLVKLTWPGHAVRFARKYYLFKFETTQLLILLLSSFIWC